MINDLLPSANDNAASYPPSDWTMVVVGGRELLEEAGSSRHSSGSSCGQRTLVLIQVLVLTLVLTQVLALPQHLWPLPHFPALGVRHGALDVGLDQTGLWVQTGQLSLCESANQSQPTWRWSHWNRCRSGLF